GHHAGEGHTGALPQVRLHADLAAQGGARSPGREPGAPLGRGRVPARQEEEPARRPRHRLPGFGRAGGDRGDRGQALVRVPDALRPERRPAPGHPLPELRRGLRGARRPLREPGGAHPGRHPLQGDAGHGRRRGPLPRLPRRRL
ncbi:MAG: Transcriptional regulator, Fur family, partial [uncultured Rubrobacteraceae bacterium]